MAKKVDLFPKKKGNDPMDEITMDNIVPLIRAAIMVTNMQKRWSQNSLISMSSIERCSIFFAMMMVPMVMKNMIIWEGRALWFSHAETLRSIMCALS